MALDQNTILEISAARNEPKWLCDWRLDAFFKWQKMTEPHWAEINYKALDYNAMNYFNRARKIDNSDLRETYEKMGLPKSEQDALLGMATDLVVDSTSVNTSYRTELDKLGIIFLPMSDAVRQYPDLVKKYLGSVVSNSDNFFAALNAAVFSDGTFVYIPKNVKCPIDLASYFRIETAKIGQFERTLIIADTGASVSYLEGCSAPRRPTHQLHSGVIEVVALDNAEIKYSTVQNWAPSVYNFVTKRARAENNASVFWTQIEVGSGKTWKYPSTILMGENSRSDFYSLAITRGEQQADTGTKMIHIGNGSSSNIVSYGIALEDSKQTFRSLVSFSENTSDAKNASKCDSRIIGNNAVANTFPTIIHGNGRNKQSHEASTGAIDPSALHYLEMAGIETDAATALIIGGMAAPVINRLPMEFLVESKQLIQMALQC
ncbi:MAG: Fe-S cluster assembly protein SufB [Rickettsiales bacterium]|jgi:Fe-S cluster assembly protein SufB|nr:Fe-S cluster assembly protein SufB [Rickettsiales bacterium]